VTRVRWGLSKGKEGENERSLEKRIEGVERCFLRKNEVLLKVEKKGKKLFLEVRKRSSRSPKKWCFKKKK